MIWDHDGTPVTPAAAVVRPVGERRRRRGAAGVQRGPGPASPPPPGAAACAGRACPCTAASCSTSPRSPGSSHVDATALVLDVRAGTFGTPLEADAAHRPRSHPRALAAVDRPLHRRRLAGVPQRGAALDALREDRGHGARPRRRARRRPHRAHRRRAARRGGPRPEPAVRRQRGHARGDHRRAVCACTRRPPPRCGPRSASPRSPPASTRAAASCAAARPRRCCGLYDAIEADRHFSTGGDDTILLVLDEGDPAIIDARAAGRARRSARPRRADDPALLDQWLERRNDVSALGHFIENGYVVDTMEIAARWSMLLGVYDGVLAALRGRRRHGAGVGPPLARLRRRRVPLLHLRWSSADGAA